MTAYTGTNHITAGRVLGQELTLKGYYDLTGALVNADTITWSGIIPKGVKVVALRFFSPEMDTDASPTMTFIIGNTDDTDGFLKTASGAFNQATSQISYEGNGDLIGTTITNQDIVFTVNAAVATGATSGRLWVEAVVRGAS